MTRGVSPIVDEMHVAAPRAAGIDVHKMQLTVSLRLAGPGAESTLALTRTFGTDPPALAAMTGWLAEHEVSAAVMEGTGVCWERPCRVLEAAGVRPRLVHARHVKQIKGRKTDVSDSLWLARICQFGLARASCVPPQEFSDLRQMCRHRRKLVAERQPEEILADLTWHVRPELQPLARALGAELDKLSLWRLGQDLQGHDQAARRIEGLDREVEAACAAHRRELNLLETVPGVQRTSACAILAELGPDPAATFGDGHALAAWAGLCPGNDQSAGKRRSGRTRRGNPTLRVTLCECAHAAGRTKDSQFHGYQRAVTARRGYKRAVFATAHKMLRIIFAMLRDDAPYRDPGIDYDQLFVQRNAPRWLRMLHRHGFLQPADAAAPAA